ncbi:MAG: TraM recognition domain-containing protein [Bradyrhizobium sp.]
MAFFFDEFGQFGRMDRLADSITLLRGSDRRLWLFVQDLSQLKTVCPRRVSFMANTTHQFFGTADYDTARCTADTLGHPRYREAARGRVEPLGVALLERTHTCRWARRQLQRRPARNGPRTGPCVRVVGNTREPAPQLNCGGELAALLERGADRSDIRFGDDEHPTSMGTIGPIGK